MAQISMNAYDADVYIPEFKGLMQYGDQMNGDLRYSPDCMNVETPGGVLQPVSAMPGAWMQIEWPFSSGAFVLGHENGTLVHLRLKKPEDAGLAVATKVYKGATDTYISVGSEYDGYLFLESGRVRMMKVTGDLMENKWYTLDTLQYDGNPDTRFINAPWEWVTYEKTDTVGTTPITSNIAILNNKDAGTFYWSGGSVITKITTPSNFNCIARFAERIWGASKDSIYYSRPFDATDWTQDNDDPANGGGEIREPTFDKDKIVGMKPLGDSLIVFSEKRAWRISGSDPTNFNIQEQLGNGTKYPETIVNMGDRLIMLGEGGLYQYDGYRLYPLMHEATHEIFRNIAYGKNTTPIATKIGDKYVLALNTEIGTQPVFEYGVNDQATQPESAVTRNSGYGYRAIVYDMVDGTITQMDVPKIISFCEGTPYFVGYYTGKCPGDTGIPNRTYESNTNKTYNAIARLRFDSWNYKQITNAATRWVSPWITFGRQDIKKGGFDLYFTPEIEPKETSSQRLWVGTRSTSTSFPAPTNDYPSYDDKASAALSDTSVTFKISIQTEKKTKTKYYTVNPMSAEDIAAGKEYKMKKLHFGGSGRRFRVIIETEAIDESVKPATPWRLIGGIHIVAEIDKD